MFDLPELFNLRELFDEAAKYQMASYPDQSLLRVVQTIDRQIAKVRLESVVDQVMHEQFTHRHGIWIDGGNDIRIEDCTCDIGRYHIDPNPWEDE